MKIIAAPLGFIIFFLVLSPLAAHSSDIVPFRTYSQHPVFMNFGLPAIGDSSILKPGKKEMAIVFDIANNCATSSTSREALILDGETYLLNMTGRFGVSEKIDVGFELPYMFQRGGFLDGFIQDYHDTFGFPNGGRDRQPNNRLLMSYRRDGATLFLVDRSGSGIGDIRLNAGSQLYEKKGDGPAALALRTSLKLPTGDYNQLRGSGSTDLALWLTASRGFGTSYGAWEIFGGAGVLGMTEGNIMPDQQRHAVYFGSLGAGWKPLKWLALKIQLDGQTAFYRDSEIDEISSGSAQVIMGGSIFFSERWELEAAVSEDFLVKTAPDVVFHFALSYRF